jgi:hypothetical protein
MQAATDNAFDTARQFTNSTVRLTKTAGRKAYDATKVAIAASVAIVLLLIVYQMWCQLCQSTCSDGKKRTGTSSRGTPISPDKPFGTSVEPFDSQSLVTNYDRLQLKDDNEHVYNKSVPGLEYTAGTSRPMPVLY